MRTKPRKLAALLVAATILATGAADAERLVRGNLEISVLGRIEPFRRPRTKPSPISIVFSGRLQTTDGTTPPQVKGIVIDLNRHGLLYSKGLPVCPLSRLEAASSSTALRGCAAALVGKGRFWAHIVLPEQRPYRTAGVLLAFNGRSECAAARHPRAPLTGAANQANASFFSGRVWPSRSRTQVSRQGERTQFVRDSQPAYRGHRDAPCHTRPELIVHVFTSNPFFTSFVIPFQIHKVSKGPYGTELTTDLPPALGSWGYVEQIKMTLKRIYTYRGKTHSYFNAACPAPKGFRGITFPFARGSFYFANAAPLSITLSRPCAVR